MKSLLLSLSLMSLSGWLGWTAYEETRRPVSSSGSRTVKADAQSVEVPIKSGSEKEALVFPQLDTLEEMVSRPLFNASRRPIEVEEIPQAEAPPSDLNVMLSGIVIGQERQIAHLRSNTDKQTLALGVGDRIGNWEIESIFHDHVVLRSGGRVETLFMQKLGVDKPAARETGSNGATKRDSGRVKRRTRRSTRRNRPVGRK
jgi:type II secretory pathway component PulC